MDKLSSVFPGGLDYYFEKVLEGIWGRQEPGRFQWGEKHLQIIKQVLVEFKKEIQKREIPFDPDSTLYAIYQEIEDPLYEMERYFQLSENLKGPKISDGIANALVPFLKSKVQELRDIASELDNE